MNDVNYVLPNVETEILREKEAAGKWRLWNGAGWVHAYDTKAEAMRAARQTHAAAIALKVDDDYTQRTLVKGW